ncbi:MAG TPA: DNA-binding protein [Bacteroidales bacterium]|nr:DNA-binding protein [Bacteroidales bacterium]
MGNVKEIIQINEIENRIFKIRGIPVMLDRDLAEFYDVKPIRLREQVKRNSARFPEDFMFQLSEDEIDFMVSQFAIPSRKHLGGHAPFVFTEQGVAAVSAVLTSPKAISVSIQIMRAFVLIRKAISSFNILTDRVSKIEWKLTDTDLKFEKVFNALEARADAPKQGIFFEGQIFDAWVFVSDLIQSAEKSIELWDHYVYASVLMLLTKRKPDTDARIYLKKVSAALQTDIDKHNSQYPPVEINISSSAHDRFLLIDNKRLYHIGASLKDLGKRCFAFSLLDAKLLLGFSKNIFNENED